MIQNWSFEIQQQLATDLILDTAYVGQYSTHLRSSFDPVNLLPLNDLNLGSLLNQPISSPQAQAAGIGLPYPGAHDLTASRPSGHRADGSTRSSLEAVLPLFSKRCSSSLPDTWKHIAWQ